MKKFLPVITILLVFALAMILAGSSVDPDPIQKKVDRIFEGIDSETSPGCALSVMQKGEIIYENGYGMANLEYGVPITPETIFHVASVSKQFTAMAIELLVNDGLVSWDDDIRDYVPEVPDLGHTITLRHLVHHVSGFRDQWSLLLLAGWRWESDVVRQRDVLDVVSRQAALNFPPGTRYLYSNTGYTLLAVVVERVSGQTLREFSKERIFVPLGMDNTHFQDDHRRIVPNRAWAYEPNEDGLFGLRNSIPVFDVVGASSLFTTVRDLAAWDRNFYSALVGGQEAVDRMHESFELSNGETIPYKHGLITGDFLGLRTVSHGGSDAGYRSQFMRFPDQDFSVAVLCNISSANPDAFARQVAYLYLEDEFPDSEEQLADQQRIPDEFTESDKDLEPYAGIYITRGGDRNFSILHDSGILFLDVGRILPLIPVDENSYKVLGTNIKLELNRSDESGETTLKTIHQSDPDLYLRKDRWNPLPGQLKPYEGRFYSSELGTEYKFAVENGALHFHHRKLNSRPLQPIFKDGFSMGGNTVVFSRDDDGEIDGFRISTARVWGVRFERI